MKETAAEENLPRRPYGKPELHSVALRPEEAVLGGCKTAGGGALSGGTCNVYICKLQAS